MYTTDDDEYNSKRDNEGVDFEGVDLEGVDFYGRLTDDRPPVDFDPYEAGEFEDYEPLPDDDEYEESSYWPK